MDRSLKPKEDETAPLPALRDDLEIVKGAAMANGAPSWVIFDPAGNRYYEIGREILDMLSLWSVGTIDRLVRRMREEFGRIVSAEDVEQTIRFLISNSLTRDVADGDHGKLVAQREASRRGWFSAAMHHYLFFKIPLVQPDRFLRATWPFAAFLFTRAAALLFTALAILGLYLTSRQWEQFTGAFEYLLSFEGAVIYGISLILVKSIHELGHAYMSVKYGLRVPTMGVAFLVLMPVLYTDTSDAWRLKSRRRRLMIDGAGIMSELALASIATVLWVLLPDGGLRHTIFAIATTSWVTSLIINLNPLMRFDGYYILSDAFGVQNLQSRGFEMARWRLRQLLFGIDEAPPETMSAPMRRLLVVHGWCVWVYRFFLFLGIALFVYAFFVKVIGILLFIVEVLWFIVKPVAHEMRRWWNMRQAIRRSRRTYVSATLFAGLVIAAFTPWSTRISAPSIMVAEREAGIFAPYPGRIASIEVANGSNVRAGDVLFRLESPQLDQKIVAAKERAALLKARINRIGSDEEDRAAHAVLLNQLNATREELRGLSRLQSELTITAPIDGTMFDMDTELHPDLWLSSKTQLGLVTGNGSPQVKGYVGEANIFRFGEGADATFVPDDPLLETVPLTVRDISLAGVEQLDQPYLAQRYGGPIATEEANQRELRPIEANYAISLVPVPGASVPKQNRAIRGLALITGTPESFFDRARRQVLKVFIRELGI